jgi:hypothetical protein
MLLIGHVVLASFGVGGSGIHLSHVTSSQTGDLLAIGFLLGIAPGLLFGVLLGRTPNHHGGKGNRGWWRFWKPAPKRPGPLPSGGEPIPTSKPVSNTAADPVPDHVPSEWSERYLPTSSPRASEQRD